MWTRRLAHPARHSLTATRSGGPHNAVGRLRSLQTSAAPHRGGACFYLACFAQPPRRDVQSEVRLTTLTTRPASRSATRDVENDGTI